MPDLNPLSRPGLKVGGTEPTELFVTQLTGDVLTAFEMNTKFKSCHTVKTISHGKGARFDALGPATAAYFTPGTNLADDGNAFKHDSFDILVDAKLMAHVWVDDLDEAMNHYDTRAKYGEQLGLALAYQYDFHVACTGLLASRHVPRVPDGFGGSVLSNAAFGTDGGALAAGLFDAQVVMDEKNVPENGRFCFVRPRHYAVLAQNLNLINSLYGGTGAIAEGTVIKVAGFTLVKSNNLPNTSVTGTFKDKYNGDFTGTVALCMNEMAVGTAKIMDLRTEVTWEAPYDAWLMKAKYALGHGVLRPECSVALTTVAP